MNRPGLLIMLICTCMPWFTYSQSRRQMNVPYVNQEIRVDGNPDDWDLRDTVMFRFYDQGDPFDNRCAVKLAWDDQNLYGLFIVFDHFLVGLEPSSAYGRLHYNDAVEFYIDSKNDSHDTMDINDYQFLIDVRGSTVIFKGDRLDRLLEFKVPKEYGTANIVFNSAVRRLGTLNKMDDLDSLYSAEFAIPWGSIGVRPKKGMSFKADFCVDDNDTLVNFNTLKPGPVKHYTFRSINGSNDFGFPGNWIRITLAGSPSIISRLTKKYSREWLYLFFFTFIVSTTVITFLFIRIKNLHRLPARESLLSTPLLKAIQNLPVPDTITEDPIIPRARSYIHEHIDEALKPEKLASELAVSLRTLQKIFKNELHSTPQSFIILIKLEKASQLLLGSDQPISDIACSLGFTDPAYFSRVFKKYFDLTPREFRHSMKTAAD